MISIRQFVPDSLMARDAAKALNAAAKAKGETGYGPQRSGQGQRSLTSDARRSLS